MWPLFDINLSYIWSAYKWDPLSNIMPWSCQLHILLISDSCRIMFVLIIIIVWIYSVFSPSILAQSDLVLLHDNQSILLLSVSADRTLWWPVSGVRRVYMEWRLPALHLKLIHLCGSHPTSAQLTLHNIYSSFVISVLWNNFRLDFCFRWKSKTDKKKKNLVNIYQ